MWYQPGSRKHFYFFGMQFASNRETIPIQFVVNGVWLTSIKDLLEVLLRTKYAKNLFIKHVALESLTKDIGWTHF